MYNLIHHCDIVLIYHMSISKISTNNPTQEEDDKDAYEQNYEFNRGVLWRNLFLFHLF